jgi:hypothetical protein
VYPVIVRKDEAVIIEMLVPLYKFGERSVVKFIEGAKIEEPDMRFQKASKTRFPHHLWVEVKVANEDRIYSLGNAIFERESVKDIVEKQNIKVYEREY